MTAANGRTLLAALCDFGWGSLGKFRLILDKLPATEVVLYGDASINDIARDMLGARHSFVHRPPDSADVALVINDPAAANRIADLNVPVIYVDSLPYLWATAEEVPHRHKIAYYCAQKFPTDRLPVSEPLRGWHKIRWVDPIVPGSTRRHGGKGVVINLGGLHSHLVGDAVDAYLNLVLLPLAKELKASGRSVLAVCGNLPADMCNRVGKLLPECRAIGRQSPYDFERMLRDADLLITSPGSTTILQAMSMKLPTLLLPPQNLSQIFNTQLYSAPGASTISWPTSVIAPQNIERLRPDGEDAVLTYIYQSIYDAAVLAEAAKDVAETIRVSLRTMPKEGVLNGSLAALGSNGAGQVAQLIKQAMLAPIPRREQPATAHNTSTRAGLPRTRH